MDNKIILYGASGHGKVVLDILKLNGIHDVLIVDDDKEKDFFMGNEVVPPGKINFIPSSKVIIAIGNNFARKIISEKLKVDFQTAIHPSAVIASDSEIGTGTVVMAGGIVNSGAVIGKQCIVNTGAVVEHDCMISDFVHISPNASLAGGVSVEEGSQIGIGASVIQNVKIGKWVTIGAGAVVINDVPDNAVVVGNPAKIIKIKPNEY